MVAPIPELMATFRVLVVPWALPSNECECDCGVLTVEAPFSVPVDRVCADRRPFRTLPECCRLSTVNINLEVVSGSGHRVGPGGRQGGRPAGHEAALRRCAADGGWASG